MNLNKVTEELKATGLVKIVHKNAKGETVKEFNVPNLVVTSGRNHIAAKIAATSNTPAAMTHMAIGTGNATPAASDLALVSQTGRATLQETAVASNAITYTATFIPGTGDGAITEAGIFNAATGGVMLCRTTFPVVNKSSGDTIAITWVVTIS